MTTQAGLRIVALLAASCGGTSSVEGPIRVAETYDVVGAMRITPDGVLPTEIRPVFLTFSALSGSAPVVGMFEAKGMSPMAIRGALDVATNQLMFDMLEGSVTTTATERIEQLGGRIDESKPEDGVGDEIIGFFRTTRGVRAVDARFVGVSRRVARPDKPVAANIAARSMMVGQVELTATAGAMQANLGVEVFRYTLGRPDPDQTLGIADGAGGFALSIDGLVDDVLVIRAVGAGVPSDAAAVIVTR